MINLLTFHIVKTFKDQIMVKKSAEWSMTHLDYVLLSLLSFTLLPNSTLKYLNVQNGQVQIPQATNIVSCQNIHKVENAILNLWLSETKYKIIMHAVDKLLPLQWLNIL